MKKPEYASKGVKMADELGEIKNTTIYDKKTAKNFFDDLKIAEWSEEPVTGKKFAGFDPRRRRRSLLHAFAALARLALRAVRIGRALGRRCLGLLLAPGGSEQKEQNRQCGYSYDIV